MASNFEFYSPTRVIFGKGTEQRVGALVREYGGTRVLVVYGGKSAVRSGVLDRAEKSLAEADLSVSADDERIIREVALFADKCDISEEITRLSSHFDQFRTLCGSSAPAGRPLDFLCQEIFREFNTIGAKANDSTLAHLVVAAKTELEKIREQVQNIE